MKPYDQAEGDELVRHELANNVRGELIRVRTDLGRPVLAWRPEAPIPVNPNGRYFCHGYTLGTYNAYGYSVSSGISMVTVLCDEYIKIGMLDTNGAQNNDIVVFWGPTTHGLDVLHSAILAGVIMKPAGGIDTRLTSVNSKTGTGPLRMGVPLDTVMNVYPKERLLEIYRRA